MDYLRFVTPNEPPGLSLTEWVVLALMAEAPSHGFAVARTLSPATELGKVWTVPRPLVYRAIGRLEEQGMITEAGDDEPGKPGPARTVYAATGKGKQAVARWLAEPVQHLREIRSVFLAKILLRQRAGQPLAALVGEQRALFAPLLQRLAEQFVDPDGERVVAAWRYESSQAVAHLLDRLEALSVGDADHPVPN